MDNPNSSPLDTLRQLKEMLDAGALTPTEFEALKQRLVFHDGATPTAPAAPAPAAAPEAPVVLPPTPALETPSPMFEDLGSTALPVEQQAPVSSAPSFESEPAPEEPAFIPPAVRRALEADGPAATSTLPPSSAPSPGLAAADAGYVADEFPEGAPTAARSPLALILSIGGLLALLGLVMYLSLNRQPSERLSSTSLTPADTLAAPIETGPQAEQMTQPVAAPETIRVAPTNPAPALPSRSEMEQKAAAVRDSATPAPAAVSDSAARQ